MSDRFPFSIAWTPIPIVTWLIPVIGHTGICDSQGRVWDIKGYFTCGCDDMKYGRPLRISRCISEQCLLDSCDIPARWDKAIKDACDESCRSCHNLFTNNCHHQVAYALRNFNLDGKKKFNQVEVAYRVFFKGKYI
jgi:hypothetical protein